MDQMTLARIACLSVSQIKQLESGGDELFYSMSIKRQAYKRLLLVLGVEPPGQLAPESLVPPEPVPHQQPGIEKLDQIIAMSQHSGGSIKTKAHKAQPIWEQLAQLGQKNKQNIVSLLILCVAAGAYWGYENNGHVEQTVVNESTQTQITMTHDAESLPAKEAAKVQASAVTAEPSSTLTKNSGALDGKSAPVAAAAASFTTASLEQGLAQKGTQAATTACAYSSDSLPQLSALAGDKASNYVHFVADSAIDICVVDGKKQTTELHLKAGESRSVYGIAPWQLSSQGLQKMQIFFQGWKINVPTVIGQKIELVEKKS